MKATGTNAIGEVLSSSITQMVAESWPADDQDGIPAPIKPRFGSFLRVDCSEDGLQIYAVVYNVITGPKDSLHKPAALQLTRDELKKQQPHIFALLKTEIQACNVGYLAAGTARTRIPPQPAQVHDFVYPATTQEIKSITEDLDFLRLISAVSAVPTDELVAAAVSEAARARDDDYDFLIRAGQTLSQLFREDYDRLAAILRKIQPEQKSGAR